MKKKIWLINQYAMPPKYEARIQTLKRAQYLMEFGHDVTIIGGSYLHNSDINLITNNEKYIERTYDGIKFIHIRTKKYSSNGLMRFYNLMEFTLRLFFLSSRFEKPDVIVQTATVPFGNLLYYMVKKLKAYYIVDVVDLWPESFVAFGLVSKNNPLLKLAYRAERWLYQKADSVVFSMEGGKDYIIEKGWDRESGGVIDLNKIHYINNGVDLKDFDENKDSFKIEDLDLENDEIFKVVYLGSIRLANNLKQLIDAAFLLKDKSNIRFLIYGDGDDREFLINYCGDNNINNVIFKQKWVELKYVPYILSKSSLNLLNYKPSPIGRFGGSQSKSFQYMASGKPICSNVKMAYCPVTKFNLGIAKNFDSSREYADAILSFVDMESKMYNYICNNARQASENYDYRKLTTDFIKLLN
ncbi:glycosyltransferase family 4 protein [Labilibaculum sp. K2S]|uniref:glycosyltransferase family 4 protein n=1 Tax=Labilibaculum sp. K2S TaxID=3056386 RepID=UPI0025A4724D|nr:glycosyltransferase family 4 protein [Labilibaculum sp. K2S]MDM8160294.1 glycosyltransferase family 4 protein [Labilibaculum sp. K2S]